MPSERSKRGLGGGIQVKTVRRRQNSADHDGGQTTSRGIPSSSQTPIRAKKRSKPSARYREQTQGALKPGSIFSTDPNLAAQYEQLVLEIYTNTQDVSLSTRQLPLRLQARRDGKDFKLTKLRDMCTRIISDNIETHVLPSLPEELTRNNQAKDFRKQHGSVKLPENQRGIFGICTVQEGDDDDYVPDDSVRPTISVAARKRTRSSVSQRVAIYDEEGRAAIHKANARILKIIPYRYRLALQLLLEKTRPQVLTYNVLSKYFLRPAAIRASKTFRAVAGAEPPGKEGIGQLLRLANLDHAAAALQMLHLQAYTRLRTPQLAPMLTHATQLREVCLRGCISVSAESIKLLVKSAGETMRVVNLNWTGIGLEGVEEVIRGCPHLEVLKAAHVQNLTESSVPAMMNRISEAMINAGFIPLGRLSKLKLRGTQVGTLAVGSLLKHCGTKLTSLDLSHTRFGGEGCLPILLLLLGLTVDGSGKPKNYNTTLRKLNLSGLSLPSSDTETLPLHAFAALDTLDYNRIHSYRQGGGSSVLGEGLHTHKIHCLLYRLALVWHHGKGNTLGRSDLFFHQKESHEPCPHHPVNEDVKPTRSKDMPLLYCHERVTISNKVFGPFSMSPLQKRCNCDPHEYGWYAVKHLDLSGIDLRNALDGVGDRRNTAWLGCQYLSLKGCLLPEEPDWESIGANGLLRSIDLSDTRVNEQGVEKLLALNPFLTSINLVGCRGIPLTRRRNFFQTDLTSQD